MHYAVVVGCMHACTVIIMYALLVILSCDTVCTHTMELNFMKKILHNKKVLVL